MGLEGYQGMNFKVFYLQLHTTALSIRLFSPFNEYTYSTKYEQVA